MLIALLFVLALPFGSDLVRLLESDAPSQSIGSISDGELVNGKRLPSRGENFVTYSSLGSLLGRTCANDKVRDAILAAYATLADKRPGTQFTYGEIAWC